MRFGRSGAPPKAGAARGPTGGQWATGAACMAAFALALARAPQPLAQVLHLVFFAVFATLGVGLRMAVRLQPVRPAPWTPPADADLPVYTVIAPLYQEAEVAAQLVANLRELDYPRDRLQVLVALEADDLATRAAVEAAAPPGFVQVVTAPAGGPRTKPRACNLALEHARGEFVVIYDAEDAPHPLQLREAAARFAAGPARLACLQAPLRVRLEGAGFIQRQFALEYAALFEATLPALARWGVPFPLGGTSNHFRRRALEAVGGWDPYNVTEDADIGLRLAARGARLGVLGLPTWETPPDLDAWLPQRARWVKGYMQTWGVQMRQPLAGGWRRFVALQGVLGYAILSALLHGPLMMVMAACALVSLSGLPGPIRPPPVSGADLLLLLAGVAAALSLMSEGARRAGGRMTLGDALRAPLYWPLQSLAAAFAMHQLVVRPFHWDKTRHRSAATIEPRLVLPEATRAVAAAHAKRRPRRSARRADPS